MKASEAKFLLLLKKSSQFVIPIYQRNYSWTEKECRQLWDDIIRVGQNSEVSAHFVGSIVYIQDGLALVSHQTPLLIIDGQQRLTTVTLLLAALANALGDDEPIKGFSAEKLRHYYLLNPVETGELHYKLLLSQIDKQTLKSIVSNKEEKPAEHSIRIVENFELFERLIKGCNGDLTAVCNGLDKLTVVDIALDRAHDNPQLIFESMNSTGRKLNQADLIRNFILMDLTLDIQKQIYKNFWHPMEKDFDQKAYNTNFDHFMRCYLTVKTGNIPKIGDVYDAFKEYAHETGATGDAIESLVKEIRDYARYYCAMALGAEEDTDLHRAFLDLSELKIDVAYPFLLELYHDYSSGLLKKTAFVESVQLVENYVFRRAICAIPTNSMNKTFANFSKVLNKDRYLESIQAHFLNLPSYRRFPTDEEFERDIQTRDLYNFRSRSYWLRRLENHGKKEHVSIKEYTIEHIMPQNKNVPKEWRAELGPEWQQVHEKWLHTLGNLTLTGYNSEYGDKPFAEKRDMQGGFAQSPLKVNAGLGQVENWTENAIQERAKRLSKIAVEIWSGPKLARNIAETYQPKADIHEQYSIEDHPNLQEPYLHDLFSRLRKEVLALDPCISEEFLKTYVAYKAETNFVDVVTASQHLKLTINMHFKDIDDPRGLCKNVSNVGKWGNGDVQIKLDRHEDIPYVVGIIRQSLEQQLGSDAIHEAS